jgi:two-component system chemotaxis response regulator CheY
MGFILISSETRFRYLDPIRQAGVIAILPKPFDAGELKVAMANTLNFIDPAAMSLESFTPEDLNVLVVDDSSLARKHIKRVLRSIGVEQFTDATDGLEAARILENQYFDLVVTDYNMPNMDGQELIDHIRKHSSQASVPVLMVTSEDNDNRLAAVQKAGVSAICDKPFAADTVRDLVQQILD